MEPAALADAVGLEVRDPAGRRVGRVAEVRPDGALVVATGRFFLFRKAVVVQAAQVARREGALLVLGVGAETYLGPERVQTRRAR